MRPLRLIAVSFPVNIIDDFGILGTFSNSILPREFTYPQFETDTNWSFFYWRRTLFFLRQQRQSNMLLQNFMFKLYLESELGQKVAFLNSPSAF